MNVNTLLGWLLLLLLSCIPVFLWFEFGPGAADLTDYASVTHSLGELFGLVGMTMFALTFVLSTRIAAIEDVFGGLDKVYIVHAVLGGSALIFILAHPIFLVLKFIPTNIGQAASYLLPSSYWSVNFGIIALIGMVLLIFITLFTKMRYHRWKFTHEFLGVVFLFAILHIFLVRNTASQDNIFDGYYTYAGIVSAIGFLAFCYSLFIKGRVLKNAVYHIKDITQYRDYFKISLRAEHKPVAYRAGQFVFLRFYNQNLSDESHPFSIASKSNDQDLVIIVKKLGDYTDTMDHLNVGDKVSVEGPYGRFPYKHGNRREQVWIAGGIGITPFLGMVQDLEDRPIGKVHLFYSANEDEFIGANLLNEVAENQKQFTFIPWNSKREGYLTATASANRCGLEGKEFFLCGPPRFKESIIGGLRAAGVPTRYIHEEVFDFR